MTDIKVIVVADDREFDALALRAGHVISMTEYDHGARTMTVWVEKGEGYVEPVWQFLHRESD